MKLILLVHSKPSNNWLRDQIRRSWAKDLREAYPATSRVYFIIGMVSLNGKVDPT